MRPASEVERRRLNEEFADLCRIRSVSGEEAEMAARVTTLLREVGVEVDEPDAAGNVLARLRGRDPARTVLLCAHLDTVPHPGVVEPVCDDGGWISAGETILGADNKAAVAVLLALARRAAIEGVPIGVELLFTTREEVGLQGAKEFDLGRLRSDTGFVYDHATPIGEVIVAAPTFYHLEAHFRGAAAHAGLHPESGRSAIAAAARAITALPLGRIDDETTTNVGAIEGGQGATNIVPEHASFLAEARSLDDEKIEKLVADIVDHVHDAANTPACACDVDLIVERRFGGYRHRPQAPAILAAEDALRDCGYEPRRVTTGGGADANVFMAQGLTCVNLANGTERAHQTDERVSVAALEGMLDVTFALLDRLAA